MPSFLVFIVFAVMSSSVFADLMIERHLEAPKLVGSGEFRAMVWKLYDAELYSETSKFVENEPFALKLIYAREISGDAIADRSIELIRRQGVEDEILLAAWHTQLNEIFPDVKRGTEIVGTHRKGEGALFYVDGQPAGSIRDPRLCRLFFGIWFSEDTVAPKLRSNLLGLASAN